jgi:hypothetical protein
MTLLQIPDRSLIQLLADVQVQVLLDSLQNWHYEARTPSGRSIVMHREPIK